MAGAEAPHRPGAARARVGLRRNVIAYRVMAYVTGVVLIVLCALAIAQVATNDGGVVNVVGTTHGLLYIVYLLVSYPLTRRLRLATWPTVAVLLAGTIPVMTFIVERWATRRFIAPALASEPERAPLSGLRSAATREDNGTKRAQVSER